METPSKRKAPSMVSAAGWRGSMGKPSRPVPVGRSQVWLTLWVMVALAAALGAAAFIAAIPPTQGLAFLVPGHAPSLSAASQKLAGRLP